MRLQICLTLRARDCSPNIGINQYGGDLRTLVEVTAQIRPLDGRKTAVLSPRGKPILVRSATINGTVLRQHARLIQAVHLFAMPLTKTLAGNRGRILRALLCSANPIAPRDTERQIEHGVAG